MDCGKGETGKRMKWDRDGMVLEWKGRDGLSWVGLRWINKNGTKCDRMISKTDWDREAIG